MEVSRVEDAAEKGASEQTSVESGGEHVVEYSQSEL